MFKVSVVNALKVNDVLSVACKKIKDGDIKIGAELSDGVRRYKVIGFPFVRYNSAEAMKENICLEIEQDGFNEKELTGKVLYSI